MTIQEFIAEFKPKPLAENWLRSLRVTDMAEAWRACEDPEFMCWLYNVNSGGGYPFLPVDTYLYRTGASVILGLKRSNGMTLGNLSKMQGSHHIFELARRYAAYEYDLYDVIEAARTLPPIQFIDPSITSADFAMRDFTSLINANGSLAVRHLSQLIHAAMQAVTPVGDTIEAAKRTVCDIIRVITPNPFIAS